MIVRIRVSYFELCIKRAKNGDWTKLDQGVMG